MLPVGEELVVGDALPLSLATALRELADDWGIALGSSATRTRFSRIEIDVRERPDEGLSERARQGYRLEVRESREGVLIRIDGGDAAGAFYGMQSLRQLGARSPAGPMIRPAEVRDWPLIARRGLIWFGGAQGRGDSIVAILRLASQYKMNFFMGPEVRWNLDEATAIMPGIRAYAESRHIELCALLGWKDLLLRIPAAEITKYYADRAALGFGTLTVSFDDLELETREQAQEAARAQVALANRVYGSLRENFPDLRFIFTPVAYGGLPGQFAFVKPDAEFAYLDVIAQGLPGDMPAFWTGDGGVFSPQVTARGAADFARAAGRKPFFWDNDTIRFANRFDPVSGREAGLHKEIVGYVANLNEFETEWREERNAQFTLLTAALYAWNPEAYSPDAAAAAARMGIAGLRQAGG